MQLFFWLALALLVIAIVGGLAYVGRNAWRAWVAFTSFAAGGAARMEALAARVDRTTVKAEGAAAKLAELDAAVARLQHAMRQVRILSDALADVRASIGVLRAFLPV